MTKKTLDQEKYETIDRLLVDEFMLVHINAMDDSVDVPPHLKNSPTLTLKLSHFFQGELRLGDRLIETDLLFKGEYYTCTIPYRTIWGVTSFSGSKTIWPESVPTQMLLQIMKGEPKQEPQATEEDAEQPKAKKKSHLRRVK